MKAGFYVYWHAPKSEKTDRHYYRLLAGPFLAWEEADKIGPRVVALVEKEDAYAAALPGASYGICRMEGPILPHGSRNASLWVSPAALVP